MNPTIRPAKEVGGVFKKVELWPILVIVCHLWDLWDKSRVNYCEYYSSTKTTHTRTDKGRITWVVVRNDDLAGSSFRSEKE